MCFGRTSGVAWAFINKDGALEYRVKFDNNAVTELAIGEVTKIDALDLTSSLIKHDYLIFLRALQFLANPVCRPSTYPSLLSKTGATAPCPPWARYTWNSCTPKS